MKIVSRYISTTIISAVLIIVLILMGIEVLVAFIGELQNIGVGNYGVLQALRFVVLDMPHQLNSFFPMAGLVGSLIGLGVLASQSELIVMRASGYSTGQIAGSVLKAAFVLAIIAMILGQVIAPYTENLANTGRAVAKSGGQALATSHGMWLRMGNDFIDIGKVYSKTHIGNVLSYQFNKDLKLKSAFKASQGFYRNGHWQLENVKQSVFLTNKVIAKQIPKLIWQVNFGPSLLTITDTTPRDMSMVKLYDYIHYLKVNGLRATSYELSFWKRVVQPFATMVMIFLAVPFIFGPLRTVTMGLRILAGVTVGFCFYILNQFFGPLSSLYQIPPPLGAALPTIVFIFAGFWLLWRMR